MLVNTDLLTDVIIVIKKSHSSIRPNSSAMKLDTLSTNLVSAGSWKRRTITWLWSRSVPIPQCLASTGSSTAAEAPAQVSQWAQLQDSWLPQNTGWEGIPSTKEMLKCLPRESWHTRCWEATSQLRPLHLQIKNGILAKSSYVFF